MSSISSLASEVGIGIATRDRWEDLEETLSRLSPELRECEVLVIDDGSVQSAPAELVSRFPWVKFERSRQNLGYIVQRNRLAQKLTAPLYLSLDDDSYPVSGDLGAAVAWLKSHPEIIALAFRVLNGAADEPAGAELAAPYPVRFYIGCAHMVRRKEFLELDGYREELEHYCEEFEFAVRAWKHGSAVYAYPGVCVRHLGSLTGRNAERLNRLLTRNDLWIAAWHFPLARFVLSVLNTLPRQLRHPAHKKYWRSVIGGYCAALRALPKVLRKRAPLSWSQQRTWRSFAHPGDLVHRQVTLPVEVLKS